MEPRPPTGLPLRTSPVVVSRSVLPSSRVEELQATNTTADGAAVNLSGGSLPTLRGLQASSSAAPATALDASFNRLADADAVAPIASLTALTTLRLGTNFLREVPPRLWEPLTALLHLDLSNNALTTLGFTHSLPPSITHLDVSLNSVAGVDDLRHAAHLTALTSLNIMGNDVEVLDGVDALPSLRALDASCNRIHSVSPLLALTSLAALSLADNALPSSDALLAVVKAMPQLTSLSVVDNPVADGDDLLDLRVLMVRELTVWGDALVADETIALVRRVVDAVGKQQSVEDVTAAFLAAMDEQRKLEEAAVHRLEREQSMMRRQFAERRAVLESQLQAVAGLVTANAGAGERQPSPIQHLL